LIVDDIVLLVYLFSKFLFLLKLDCPLSGNFKHMIFRRAHFEELGQRALPLHRAVIRADFFQRQFTQEGFHHIGEPVEQNIKLISLGAHFEYPFVGGNKFVFQNSGDLFVLAELAASEELHALQRTGETTVVPRGAERILEQLDCLQENFIVIILHHIIKCKLQLSQLRPPLPRPPKWFPPNSKH
jgi:hypothetical protein